MIVGSAYITGISPARPAWYSRTGGKRLCAWLPVASSQPMLEGVTSEDKGRFLERQVHPLSLRDANGEADRWDLLVITGMPDETN